MANIYTIDKIEGNSFIGNPVFSRFGMKQNYNYIVMSPQKKDKTKKVVKDDLLDRENLKFKIDHLNRTVTLNGPQKRGLGDGLNTAPETTNDHAEHRKKLITNMKQELEKKMNNPAKTDQNKAASKDIPDDTDGKKPKNASKKGIQSAFKSMSRE